MGSPVIWNGRTGKNLSPDGIKAKNGRQELYLEVDPRTTATDANQGDFLSSIYGKFQKLDNGSSTNWKRIDAEVSPYKLYDSFEMDTVASLPANWTKYGNTDTALNYPDNFGGTASASSYTTVANTGLSGANLFRASVSSSDNGKGVYKSFSIANGEKGLPFIFESQINLTKTGSAEWASNAQIWVVGSNDNFVSNFQNIPLTNYVVSKSGLLKGSFIDSSATLTNFRLCIHFSGLTDTFNVDFDEVKIYSGAQDTLSSIVSEWFSYTPTFQGFGTPTNIQCYYRQVGSNIEVRGRFTSGTTTAVEGQIGLPNGSIDSSKLSSISIVGNITRSTTTSAGNGGHGLIIAKGGDNYLNYTYQGPANGGLTAINGNSFFSSGEIVSFFASVPIAGLNQFGSNVIASSENFMPIKGVKTATQSVPTNTHTEIYFEGTSNDTRINVANGRFSLPSNGRYIIQFKAAHSGTGGYATAEIRKNGVANVNYTEQYENASNEKTFTFVFDTAGDLSTDYYSIWYQHQVGSTQPLLATKTYMSVDRLDKPFSMNLFQAAGMVLSPTDNVLPAQFSRSTTQSIPNATTTTIIWDTINFNPSNAISLNTSTGRMTNNGPSGYYKFSGMIRSASYSGASTMVGAITRSVNSGTPVEIGFSGSSSGTTYMGLPFETTVFLSTGSYIDIIVYQETGATNSFSIRNLDVQRVDKTAVSAGGGYTKWQRKTTSSNLTSGNTFTFNNLEIGKQYKLTIFHQVYADNGTVGSKYLNHNIYHNGSVIFQLPTYAYNVGEFRVTWSPEHIFTAQNTTISGNIDSVSLLYLPSGAMFTLEELPQHIQTNQWT